MYLTVKPAYGVVLNSLKAVKEHFNANKDFIVLSMNSNGRYVNKDDAFVHSIKLEIRYGKHDEKVVILP